MVKKNGKGKTEDEEQKAPWKLISVDFLIDPEISDTQLPGGLAARLDGVLILGKSGEMFYRLP